MNVAEFVPVELGVSFAAGFLGSLTGLGGGVMFHAYARENLTAT